MEFIIDNWFLIIIAIAIVAAVVFMVVDFFKMPTKAQINQVREWLLYAVVMAEKELGSGTGALKLRMTYDMFVEKFPWVAKAITFEAFSIMVDEALVKMKTMLESNKDVQTLVNGD